MQTPSEDPSTPAPRRPERRTAPAAPGEEGDAADCNTRACQRAATLRLDADPGRRLPVRPRKSRRGAAPRVGRRARRREGWYSARDPNGPSSRADHSPAGHVDDSAAHKPSAPPRGFETSRRESCREPPPNTNSRAHRPRFGPRRARSSTRAPVEPRPSSPPLSTVRARPQKPGTSARGDASHLLEPSDLRRHQSLRESARANRPTSDGRAPSARRPARSVSNCRRLLRSAQSSRPASPEFCVRSSRDRSSRRVLVRCGAHLARWTAGVGCVSRR